MAKQSITVFNSGPAGYRRAGIVFNKGDNVIDGLSAAQIQQIENDPRLVLQNADSAESADQAQLVANSGSVDGVIDTTLIGDGTGKSLPPLIDPPEGVAAVVAIIYALQAAGTLELTGSGKPTTGCLEAAEENIEISAAQRDEAWAWIKANPDYQAEQISEGNA